ARDPKEIVIGPTSTMQLRILSLCISRQWKEGDEVIVTNTDHEANVSCWTDLEERGIKIKIWKIDRDSFELKTEDLEKLLSSRTKDRKSTRLNSSHVKISYAVFCLKKKKE